MKRLKQRGGIIALAGVAMFSLAYANLPGHTMLGCAEKEMTPAPDAGAPVVIGVVLGLSGGFSGKGANLLNAVRTAERQINAYGGVLGRRIEYRVVDDASDREVGLMNAVNGLLAQDVSALLGPIGSPQVRAVFDLVAARNVPNISSNATSPLLTDKQGGQKGWFFRTVPTDSLQGRALARYAFGASGGGAEGGVARSCKRMAIVHNSDDYGNPLAASLKTTFEKLGGTVVLDLPVPSDAQPSYVEQVSQVVKAKPDCQAMAVYAPTAAAYMRDFVVAKRDAGFSASFFTLGTDGAFNPDFISKARVNPADPAEASAAEDVYGTNPEPNPQTAEFGQFKNVYTAGVSIEGELPGNVANMYDAAVLMALAIQKAKTTTDRTAIRDALFEVSRPPGTPYGPSEVPDALATIFNEVEVDYNGASGPCDFDERGDVLGNYIVWHVEKGKFVTISRIKAGELGGE